MLQNQSPESRQADINKLINKKIKWNKSQNFKKTQKKQFKRHGEPTQKGQHICYMYIYVLQSGKRKKKQEKIRAIIEGKFLICKKSIQGCLGDSVSQASDWLRS